jgi:hypothetical protein
MLSSRRKELDESCFGEIRRLSIRDVALHHQKPQLGRQSAAVARSFAIAFAIQLLPPAPQKFLLSILHLLFVFLSRSQLHPNHILLLGSRAILTVVLCRIATVLALLAYPAIDMDHVIVL